MFAFAHLRRLAHPAPARWPVDRRGKPPIDSSLVDGWYNSYVATLSRTRWR